MEQQASRTGRRAFWFTCAAFTWSAGVVGAAFLVPVYGSSTASLPDPRSHAAAALTLVQVNGLRVLIPIAAPVLITTLVWVALHRKCSHGGRTSGLAAWALIGMLSAGSLVAIASVGLFVAPVAGLLAYAASLTPSGTPLGGAATGGVVA